MWEYADRQHTSADNRFDSSPAALGRLIGLLRACRLIVLLADQRDITASAVRERRGHNKATIAVANKLGRIVWAVWTKDVPTRSQRRRN